MSGVVRNKKLNRKDYEDLLLVSLVDSELIQHIKITINKIDPDTKEIYIQETTVKAGDMVEIISLHQLNLIYTFGRIKRINFKQNYIHMDISDDYESSDIYINISDIRDISIYQGLFLLYPSNNNITETYCVYDDETNIETCVKSNDDDGFEDENMI